MGWKIKLRTSQRLESQKKKKKKKEEEEAGVKRLEIRGPVLEK